MAKTKNKKIQRLKEKIYEKYGWTVAEWAKRRGFDKWSVYNLLHGRINGKRSKKARLIKEALEKDLGEEFRCLQ